MEREDNLSKPSRQELALDRTHLANERTLLSYIRTALAIIGFSVIILRFDTSKNAGAFGISLLVIAIAILVFGIYRFNHFKRKIASDKAKMDKGE